MKFDLLHILKNFAVEDGRLVRRLATGHSKPVRLVDRGRLAVVLGGVKFYGAEVAYACIYRVVPMYPIVQVDGDPFNCAEDNLMPCRFARIRYRLIEVPGGHRHPLSRSIFRTELEARNDWVSMARAYYRKDKPYVRQMEDQMQGRKPAVVRRVETPRKVYKSVRRLEDRPEAVAGRIWHWWKDGWLSLPVACHCSDDWMVRAAAVELDPNARFVYDPITQRTVQFTLEGELPGL